MANWDDPEMRAQGAPGAENGQEAEKRTRLPEDHRRAHNRPDFGTFHYRLAWGRKWSALAAANVAGVIAILPVANLLDDGDGDGSPSPPPPIVDACLKHDPVVNAEPGEVVTLDASLNLGACDTEAEIMERARWEEKLVDAQAAWLEAKQQGDRAETARLFEAYQTLQADVEQRSTQATMDAVEGAKARLQLAAPLFSGKMGPISEVDQVLHRDDHSATWAWELRPDRPGEYKLSLVLSILDSSNDDLLVQNERVEVDVHVERTFGYYAGRVWANVLAFFTSLQGLVASAVAIAGSVLGARQLLRRRSSGQQQGAPGSAGEPSQATGEGEP
jgi:hypothetical protein